MDAPALLVEDLLKRTTFPQVGPVTCAVSGGADSLALLVLARRSGLRATAIHVDHGLRPESAAEAGVVARACESLGASFRSERVDLHDGPNLEERARVARTAVLPQGCLTGHTADDQAETLLLALLRGSGPAGLAGIDPSTRPILGIRRHETKALCTSLGLEVVTDPTNVDPRFRRNRIRHEVLPLLCEVAGRDVVPLLCRSAAVSAGVAAALTAVASDVDGSDVESLRAVPPAVAAEALRREHRNRTGSPHPPDLATIERLRAVYLGDVRAAQVAGGWRVRRSGGRLHWDREVPSADPPIGPSPT